MMSKLIEYVAADIYRGDPESPYWHVGGGDEPNEYDWVDGSEEDPQPYYRRLAAAAITAIDAYRAAAVREAVDALIADANALGVARAKSLDTTQHVALRSESKQELLALVGAEETK